MLGERTGEGEAAGLAGESETHLGGAAVEGGVRQALQVGHPGPEPPPAGAVGGAQVELEARDPVVVAPAVARVGRPVARLGPAAPAAGWDRSENPPNSAAGTVSVVPTTAAASPSVHSPARMASTSRIGRRESGKRWNGDQMGTVPAGIQLGTVPAVAEHRELDGRILLLDVVEAPDRLEQQHRPLVAIHRTQDAGGAVFEVASAASGRT